METVDPGEGFTEDGNLVTRDLLYDKATNKQFITVQTSGGNTFYIVIDYDKPTDEDGEQYQTYFLNMVDEADLLAAMQAAGGELPECACADKCAVGAINTDCTVCAVNMGECQGKAPEPVPVVEPEPDPEPEQPKATGNGGMLLLALAVVVIGGGNVAMDVTRSSIRLGAEKVTCVYRRRIEDMTALPDEITGAMAEGAEIAALMAPSHIEADEDGNAAALWVQPQIIGEADKSGRPRPNKADLPEVRIPADIIVVAIGQGIEIQGFEQAGVPIKRGTFVAGLSGQVGDMDNVFAGGDCVTGPATAIRAIAAGKVAAANIDEHLGFRHEIKVELDIPAPRLNNRAPHGRINTTEREACERRCDFEDIECGLTEEGARTEASRCLRCDHYGYGIFRGGRNEKW